MASETETEVVLAGLEPSTEDIIYEEELLRNPYSFKLWWRYIQAKTLAPPAARNLLFERALKNLPGSYKLWLTYLRERRQRVYQCCLDDPGFEALNNTFERALVWMHKVRNHFLLF